MIKDLIMLIIILFCIIILIIPNEGDYEYFDIQPPEKWGDLNNVDKITDFCEHKGYDIYTMKRYSNHKEYPLILSGGVSMHYVSNPDDAYIVCIKLNGDEKKYNYRDLKEWMLENGDNL